MQPLPVLSCSDCGACCQSQGTPPFARLDGDCPPPELDWDVNTHALRYDLGLPCLWWDEASRRCRHYEHRPAACREFLMGGEDCLRMRREAGISSREEKS